MELRYGVAMFLRSCKGAELAEGMQPLSPAELVNYFGEFSGTLWFCYCGILANSEFLQSLHPRRRSSSSCSGLHRRLLRRLFSFGPEKGHFFFCFGISYS
jgi:hypothetical protein